jgi:hypothetical protein
VRVLALIFTVLWSRRHVSRDRVIDEVVLGNGLALKGAFKGAFRASTGDTKSGSIEGGDVFLIPGIAVESCVEFCPSIAELQQGQHTGSSHFEVLRLQCEIRGIFLGDTDPQLKSRTPFM